MVIDDNIQNTPENIDFEVCYSPQSDSCQFRNSILVKTIGFAKNKF